MKYVSSSLSPFPFEAIRFVLFCLVLSFCLLRCKQKKKKKKKKKKNQINDKIITIYNGITVLIIQTKNLFFCSSVGDFFPSFLLSVFKRDQKCIFAGILDYS